MLTPKRNPITSFLFSAWSATGCERAPGQRVSPHPAVAAQSSRMLRRKAVSQRFRTPTSGEVVGAREISPRATACHGGDTNHSNADPIGVGASYHLRSVIGAVVFAAGKLRLQSTVSARVLLRKWGMPRESGAGEEISVGTDIVVIRAGVIGSSIALELARAGHRVTVLERAPGVGQGSTSASSAVVRFNFSTVAGVGMAWEAHFDSRFCCVVPSSYLLLLCCSHAGSAASRPGERFVRRAARSRYDPTHPDTQTRCPLMLDVRHYPTGIARDLNAAIRGTGEVAYSTVVGPVWFPALGRSRARSSGSRHRRTGRRTGLWWCSGSSRRRRRPGRAYRGRAGAVADMRAATLGIPSRRTVADKLSGRIGWLAGSQSVNHRATRLRDPGGIPASVVPELACPIPSTPGGA